MRSSVTESTHTQISDGIDILNIPNTKARVGTIRQRLGKSRDEGNNTQEDTDLFKHSGSITRAGKDLSIPDQEKQNSAF